MCLETSGRFDNIIDSSLDRYLIERSEKIDKWKNVMSQLFSGFKCLSRLNFWYFRYHLDCLSPQLHHVPIEDWYCPRCSREKEPPCNQSVPKRPTRVTRRRGARTVAETTNFARAARAWYSGASFFELLFLSFM